jgi:hypothetical protein
MSLLMTCVNVDDLTLNEMIRGVFAFGEPFNFSRCLARSMRRAYLTASPTNVP